MTEKAALFSPITLGDIDLKNRILMSPMTRARVPTRVPDKSSEIYYTQRAGAGLIVTEATTVSLQGNGSIATPGIYNAAQIDGWRRVTDAVHHAGGRIMCQLWHTGRVSHSSMQPDQGPPVSASDVHGQVQTFTSKGFERTTAPRALALEEIPAVTAQFVQAARNAIQAGFDGVELHAGSGYLLDQFLRDGTNRRQDRYGGSIANRCRFVLEILDAVTAEIGGGRTAIRISPMLVTWDCRDSDTVALFSHLVEQLSKRDIAFLDMIERNDASIAVGQDDDADSREHGVRAIRAAYTGTYVANGAYDRKSAMAALDSGYAEAISFGRDYISTPDLAQRLATGAALNPAASPLAYYGDGGDAGYIDFPSLPRQ
ncbi:MAG: alkene reductase [Candidatus Competibacteraceae bacterium]|jgi:N-ethylmaleimide reductase|nr:alkene reductase [Candidatus Competibacteraceae bacterium]